MFKQGPNNSFQYIPKKNLLDVKGTMSRPHKNRITNGAKWRQKQKRIDEPEGLVLGNMGNYDVIYIFVRNITKKWSSNTKV